ncbi:MAG: PfkB family carbohydrate kinase [Oscillospiraceae bacterium]|nr:PfkB family carbohydrate kinase [Oscillospiraceae bacterium]
MNIFDKMKDLSIAVLGDYYLDEYFRIDAALNEPSLETGLVAYQCVKCESFPGASGTVAKNLANLGVGTVYAVGYTGDDGRGMEMRRGLDVLGINSDNLLTFPGRCTPTHTKPWITENGQTRELNRIDIKNWTTTPPELEEAVLDKLIKLIKNLDALIILDHAAEDNCGIITDTMRESLAQVAKENQQCLIFADSRGRIGKFRNMIIKGNQFELCHAVYGHVKSADHADNSVALPADPSVERTEDEITYACKSLYKKTGRPVVCTMGENGAKIYTDTIIEIPGIQVSGELDVCGGGDMFSSTFVSTLAAGASMEMAGNLANKAAAICVQQLGTSGYVTADDLK